MSRPPRRSNMLRIFLAVACASSGVSAAAAALKIDLPPETAVFKAGPHLDLVKSRCLICHSADYVSTQPPNLPRATWNAEVAKMRKVYGATFGDEDVEPLV